MPSQRLREGHRMTSLTTAAVAEQIDLGKTQEAEPAIKKTAPACGGAQASRAANPAPASPFRLNTTPSPASGPGGPSLTSRRH
jgi:hypothetical protein